MNDQTRYYHAASTVVADGWIVGRDLNGITGFMHDVIVEETDDASDSSSVQIGLIDSATVPNPMNNVAFNAIARFIVQRTSPTFPVNPNKFVFLYIDGVGATHFWGGAAWDGAPTYFGGAGKYVLKVWDDGTNYKADLLRFEDRVSILANTVSIAKASVGAFANGRVFIWSEPLTNFYYLGQYFENLFIRKYVEPEPTHGAWGAEESV
jgi:hypothetical protein